MTRSARFLAPLLLSAALVATASFAQTPARTTSAASFITPSANTTAPSLSVFCLPGGVAWVDLRALRRRNR